MSYYNTYWRMTTLNTTLWLFRFILASSFLLTASFPSQANVSQKMRHLVSRTGFGTPTLSEVMTLTPLSYEEAVEQLLKRIKTTPQTNPPPWIYQALQPNKFRQANAQQKKDYRKKRRQKVQKLKAWWYFEMIDTYSPLTEKLTLFWHNHFTSSIKKIKWPRLMFEQNLMLRKYAAGNFRDLLTAIIRDPAMMLYLDNQTNKKGHPNENFARELLELFTLGEGHYSEKDIKEAARAFTGWKANRTQARFRFVARQHDYGIKTFMGKTGQWNGDDIIRIILEQPRLAEYISEKMWKEFVSEEVNSFEIKRLAKIFRQNDYEIKPLLKAILMTSEFQEARGTLIKSPIELLVGTIRLLDMPLKNTSPLVRYGRQLGQDIFAPPNVKGWPGGTHWINAHTLLKRKQILNRLFQGQEKAKNTMFMISQMENLKHLKLLEPQELKQLLLPIEPVFSGKGKKMDFKKQLKQLVLDPAFQLK